MSVPCAGLLPAISITIIDPEHIYPGQRLARTTLDPTVGNRAGLGNISGEWITPSIRATRRLKDRPAHAYDRPFCVLWVPSLQSVKVSCLACGFANQDQVQPRT